VTLRTDYIRREALPAGISPLHFGRDVVMPRLVVMMMVVMVVVVVVVVMVMMMIAVLLPMVPRRVVRAMNRVGRVGGSQRQRVHPLYFGRGKRESCNTSEAKDVGFIRRCKGGFQATECPKKTYASDSLIFQAVFAK